VLSREACSKVQDHYVVPCSIRKRGISAGGSKIPEVDVIFVATDM
jgi:hypothetical protein